jgi:hypothetical protein
VAVIALVIIGALIAKIVTKKAEPVTAPAPRESSRQLVNDNEPAKNLIN